MTASEIHPVQLAAELVRLVKIDLAQEPARYGTARSWEDLHDVCDANEFLIDALEALNIDLDLHDPALVDLLNAAVDIAEKTLWPDGPRPHVDPSTVARMAREAEVPASEVEALLDDLHAQGELGGL